MISDITQLYYITHIDNISSMLKEGILSHKKIQERNLNYTSIYDKDIVQTRKDKQTPDNKSLWEYANFYFNARNPMLYRVVCEKLVDKIAVIGIDPAVLQLPKSFVTTGNAASPSSEILPAQNYTKILSDLKEIIKCEWWTDEDSSKRKIMAECLVPDKISSDSIKAIYVASHEIADQLKGKLKNPSVQKPKFSFFGKRSVVPEYNIPDIIPHPEMFFKPFQQSQITQYLSIVKGDLFFSRYHTLVVSVNIVGVMGKGLASRAKYQFPRLYVAYQDLCRKGILQMGKPHLYKGEKSFDELLADEPATMKNGNGATWFLLFPTKRHWRENSDLSAIEKGMQWLKENYAKEGIKSLAIPALGCGLGKLDWKDVGPMMCKYLSTFNVRVQNYLPAERKIEGQYLTKEFLLSKTN